GLTTAPLRWQHTHQFEHIADDATRVTDRLITNVPARVLRSVFEYRHRQLADELASLQRSWAWNRDRLVIGITGASGLVGSQLCDLLTTSGHRVVRLVRRDPAGSNERRWDPANPAPGLLDGLDALVHLAGAPIFGRFNDTHKALVHE